MMWPELNYSDFTSRVDISRQEICREVFERYGQAIRIKKEKTINKNLGAIFDAVLKIANQKGFQAMSMRDLSRETGLSMGALYAYFPGKDELLQMLQETGRNITRRVMAESLESLENPAVRLRVAIKTHLFLSEAMQPWFYFSYMEARHLSSEEREKAVRSELETEKTISDIIRDGQRQGLFEEKDPDLTASMTKAMIQDWYVKRGKHGRRNLTVDHYADHVIDMVSSFLNPKPRLQ